MLLDLNMRESRCVFSINIPKQRGWQTKDLHFPLPRLPCMNWQFLCRLPPVKKSSHTPTVERLISGRTPVPSLLNPRLTENASLRNQLKHLLLPTDIVAPVISLGDPFFLACISILVNDLPCVESQGLSEQTA